MQLSKSTNYSAFFFFKSELNLLRRVDYYKCWLHVSHLFRFSLYINDVFR